MKKNTSQVKKKTTSKTKVEPKVKAWPNSHVELKNFIVGSAVSFLALIVLILLTIFFCQSLVSLIKNGNIVGVYNAADLNKNNELNKAVELDEVERLSNLIYFGKEDVSDNNLEESPSPTFLSEDLTISEREFMTLPAGVTGFENLNFINSPDGSKFAFVVKRDSKEAVLLNGDLGPFYDKITFMAFSPDSSRFAYGVKVGYDDMVVLDGLPGKIYDWIFLPRFFSPDSQYFIYKARSSEGDFLVFNETEGAVYEQIYQPFVSDDNSSVIFYSRRGTQIYKSVLELNSKN